MELSLHRQDRLDGRCYIPQDLAFSEQNCERCTLVLAAKSLFERVRKRWSGILRVCPDFSLFFGAFEDVVNYLSKQSVWYI